MQARTVIQSTHPHTNTWLNMSTYMRSNQQVIANDYINEIKMESNGLNTLTLSRCSCGSGSK